MIQDDDDDMAPRVPLIASFPSPRRWIPEPLDADRRRNPRLQERDEEDDEDDSSGGRGGGEKNNGGGGRGNGGGGGGGGKGNGFGRGDREAGASNDNGGNANGRAGGSGGRGGSGNGNSLGDGKGGNNQSSDDANKGDSKNNKGGGGGRNGGNGPGGNGPGGNGNGGNDNGGNGPGGNGKGGGRSRGGNGNTNADDDKKNNKSDSDSTDTRDTQAPAEPSPSEDTPAETSVPTSVDIPVVAAPADLSLPTETVVVTNDPATVTTNPDTVTLVTTLVATPEPIAEAVAIMSGAQSGAEPLATSAILLPEQLLGVSGGIANANPRVTDPSPNNSLGERPAGEGLTSSEGLRSGSQGLDTAAERALVAVGSIGGFIFVCFLSWLVFRMVKRSKEVDGNRLSSFSTKQGRPSFRPSIGRLLSKIPWVRNKPWAQGWQDLDDQQPMSRMYNEKLAEDQRRLDSGVYMHDSRMADANNGMPIPPQMMGSYSRNPEGGPPLATNSIPTNDITRSNTIATMATMGTAGTGTNAYMTPQPIGVTTIHGANPSISSMAVQYGGYYNQAGLSRQPSDAQGPGRRQVNRISELSSISSGFGDGDIIAPPVQRGGASMEQTYAETASDPAPSYPDIPVPPPLVKGSRSSMATSSNRDTVYTTTSDDSPPRFRTVSSWVRQQTGQVRRVQQRGTQQPEGHPPLSGMPAGPGQNGLPPEPQYNMMMDDGEVPRRVETT